MTVTDSLPSAESPVESLDDRATGLRLTSPAAYVAMADHADKLTVGGVAPEEALERALRAVGR